MPSLFRFLRSIRFAVLFGALLLPTFGQTPEDNTDDKKKQPRVRFICVSALAEDQKLILASRDEEDKWLEIAPLMLRSSFITDWLPAKTGQLHLTVRDGETLKSIGIINYPAGARGVLAVLLPDNAKNIYNSFVVDPEKAGLAKGSVLVVNFSKQTGMLLLGTKKISIASGQKVVAKPALEANGMYRLLVAYQDAANKPVPCYDRYLPGNPDSRDMLFLFPDNKNGLRVFSLPMFGEMD